MNKSPIRNQEEIDQFVEGEKLAQGYMDIEYHLRGYQIINRNGNRARDLLIAIDGQEYKVEEKFRSSDYGDFLVEILQCMITKEVGWFYKTKADILAYVICKDWKPYHFYLVDWRKFPQWFNGYLLQNKSPKCRISSRGIGLTLNLAISWGSIPDNIYERFEATYEENLDQD